MKIEGHVVVMGWGLWRVTSNSITHTNLHKSNNKLVRAYLKCFWCMDKPQANMDSQDSSWFGLGGSHHLPPYNIMCAWPWGQHPKVILSQYFQIGVTKFPKLGFSQFWRPITLCADLRLKWSLKQSCNLHWEFPTKCNMPPKCKEIRAIIYF